MESSLALIESAIENKKHKEAITEVKKELVRLKEDYKLHITEYNKEYMRSMMELSKTRVLNPVDGELVLQSSAWKPGDTKRLRNPQKKKKNKKDEKNKKKLNKRQKVKK